LATLVTLLRIGPQDTVFYSIDAWDPRKHMAALIDGFARCFTADDPVILVVKTNRRVWFDDPSSPHGDRDVANTVRVTLNRVEMETGRPTARVSLIADDDTGDNIIDGLDTLGHFFVSFSSCEGFGLSCFDAATYGRPVIAVAYGGPLDYLGDDWPGRIPHRLIPCRAPPECGLFDTDQSWPELDDTVAFAHMRAFVKDRTPFATAAIWTSAIIHQRFGAAAVGRQLMAALDLTN
jgi:glycosyltransferase involved in cell wall biosynthesis